MTTLCPNKIQTQYEILSSYIDRLQSLHSISHPSLTPRLFVSLVSDALKCRSEHEHIPVYIENVTKYVHDSEILMAGELFVSLHTHVLYIPVIDRLHLLQSVYCKLQKFGVSRGWDLDVLHYVILQKSRVYNFELIDELFKI